MQAETTSYFSFLLLVQGPKPGSRHMLSACLLNGHRVRLGNYVSHPQLFKLSSMHGETEVRETGTHFFIEQLFTESIPYPGRGHRSTQNKILALKELDSCGETQRCEFPSAAITNYLRSLQRIHSLFCSCVGQKSTGWVLCLGSHKAKVKVSASLDVTGGRIDFYPHQVVAGISSLRV